MNKFEVGVMKFMHSDQVKFQDVFSMNEFEDGVMKFMHSDWLMLQIVHRIIFFNVIHIEHVMNEVGLNIQCNSEDNGSLYFNEFVVFRSFEIYSTDFCDLSNFW